MEEGEEGGRRKKERRERGGRRGRCQRAPYEPSDGVGEEIGVAFLSQWSLGVRGRMAGSARESLSPRSSWSEGASAQRRAL